MSDENESPTVTEKVTPADLDAFYGGWKSRAEKAETERDEARRERDEAVTTRDEFVTVSNRRSAAEAEIARLQDQVTSMTLSVQVIHNDRARLREAVEYLFGAYLPTAVCEGPRDCVGTARGCSHCVPDAKLDEIRPWASVE